MRRTLIAAGTAMLLVPPSSSASASPPPTTRALTPEQIASLSHILPPLKPGQEVRIVIETEDASGTGVGARYVGAEAAGEYDHSAPSATLSGGTGALGGGGIGEFRVAGGSGSAVVRVLVALGGLGAIGAGGWLVRRGSHGHAAGAIVAGLALLLAAAYPALLVPLLAAAACIAVSLHTIAALRAKTQHEALRALAGGAAELDDAARAALMARVRHQAEGTDLPTIAAVAAKDGLTIGV